MCGGSAGVTLICIIAGEESGDALGARLMLALRQARPDAEFMGVGGIRMQGIGFTSLFPMRELAVMGLLEVLPKVVQLRRRLNETAQAIIARRPDVVVTIDSPGFTLRLLKRIKGAGLRRVHYVAPQVWAWREGRVKHFPGLWDRLLCLLPFEPAFFRHHGLAAEFVGHPVIESGADTGDAVRFRARHGVAPDKQVLIVMPGSRRSEVGRLLPVFGETLDLLLTRFPDLVPVVPVADAVADAVRAGTQLWRVQPIVVTETADKFDAFAAASAALAKSGTSTLELALAGVPMVVAYRVNPVTGWIARRLITVEFVCIVNLLAGGAVVPELLQRDATPARLAAELGRLLADPDASSAQRTGSAAVMAGLRPAFGLPSEAAAREVLAVGGF